MIIARYMLFFRRYLSKSYGPLRIRQELRQKGFPSEIIERVLEENRN
ncbi:regulatory protein [Proteus mirabilis]|uniref:Regulatory protein RecX n=1 Tax=Proteus mirabilis TaxID=584 RepID=A0A2X2BLL5_PROMI|nr:regulatory protein [Proteus mirabilis]